MTDRHATPSLPPPEVLDDDRPIGRVLSRREVLAIFGGVGATAVVAAAVAPTVLGADATSSPPASATPGGSAVPTCIVRPAETEGPYFVDERLQRSDIRTDTADGSVEDGLPLQLSFQVSKIEGSACTLFEGAMIDVWHCSAQGSYSDVSNDPTFGDTSGSTYLRGYQLTDASGAATFTTVYPGWYQGRTVHIHFKIRTDPDSSSGFDFTSQLFFDDATSDTVFSQDPYAAKGTRQTRNANDGIFAGGGDELLLALTPLASGGYSAVFPIGVQIS